MIITIASILIITVVVWLINKKLSFKICPICAGVALTWIWLFIMILLGRLSYLDYQLIIAILMGGTVAGVMFKLEKFIQQKFILIWKTLFVISCFSAVNGILTDSWLAPIVSLTVAIIFSFIFKEYKTTVKNKSAQESEIEEKMKNCC